MSPRAPSARGGRNPEIAPSARLNDEMSKPVTYIALLRGINVGGNKPVAMAALREMLAKLGFDDAMLNSPERQPGFSC